MNALATNLCGSDDRVQSLARRLPPFAILLVLAALSLGRVFAQSYAIDWHTINGGGGTSTNGTYSLSGAIGPAAASTSMTNGLYSLTGDFWVLPIVIQEPSAPLLSVVPAAPGFVLISWAPNKPGFVLQESLALDPPAWTNSPSGATNPVTLPVDQTAKVYRLQK